MVFSVSQCCAAISSLQFQNFSRTSLAVQWLTLPFHLGGSGLIPGWGTKILHAVLHSQKSNKQTKWKTFPLLHKNTPYEQSNHSLSSLLCLLVSSNLLFVFLDLPVVCISHKRSQATCDFVFGLSHLT